MDPFQEIAQNDIPKLMSILKANLPRTIHVYSYLSRILDWRKKDPTLEYHILAPNGDFTNATVFFYTLSHLEDGGIRMSGSVHTLEEERIKSLEDCLMRTIKVDWSWDFVFTCLDEKLLPVVRRVLEAKGRASGIEPCFLFWLPAWKAAQVQLGQLEGVELKELREEDSYQINDAWLHKYNGSRKTIGTSIKFNFGYGVFTKDEGKLVSWALLSYSGAIGAVGTVQEYKKKGYATLAVNAVARRMGQEGMDVHADIVKGNDASKRMFRKLGYSILSEHDYWVRPMGMENVFEGTPPVQL